MRADRPPLPTGVRSSCGSLGSVDRRRHARLKGNHVRPASRPPLHRRKLGGARHRRPHLGDLPITEQELGSTPEGAPADIDAAVTAARGALDGDWGRSTAAERADVIDRLYALFLERSDDLANLITAEVGSPLLFSHFGQVGATGMALDYFAKLTRSFAFEEVRDGMMGPALVRHEPVGVCAGIVPWNVPLFISMLKLAPALASGSTMVLKPAPETPLRLRPGRAVRRRRRARRRGQHRAGRPGDRTASGDPSRRRQGQLHRVDRRRTQDRCRLRRAAAPGHARVGRQIRRHRV
jgi:hypothetical protein